MTSNVSLMADSMDATIMFAGVSLNIDSVVENDEVFTLSLPDQQDVDYTIGANSTIDITIINIDSESLVSCILVI